jgi:hypothetical protein
MSFMEALGYAGDTIAKPGRAVRGVLAGRLEELANLVPFSDTLGLTDPTKQVHGRDLLNQLGATQADDDGWGAMLGGLGVDIATDPLTYFGGAMLRGAMGAGRAGVGAVPGSDAAQGIFRLDDPIERLMTPAQAAEREAFNASVGQTSPWAPLADELHPVPDAPAPSSFTPFEGKLELPPPPAEPYGSAANVFDPAFSPKTRGTFLAYGPDYTRIADDLGWGADQVGMGHWSSSIPTEMAEDFQRYGALRLNLDKWDEELGMLNSLPTEAQASLGFPSAVDEFDLDLASEIATRSPNATGWQRILGTRNLELAELRELAMRGAIPAELAPQMERQIELLAGMAGEYASRGPAAEAIYGLRQYGNVMPSRVGELTGFGGPLAHLPIDEAALAKMAEGAQMDALLETMTSHLQNFENRAGGLTPAMLNPNYPTSPHLAQRLDEAMSPEFWSGEGIDPAVLSKLLGSPEEYAIGYHEMIRNAQDLLPELRAMAANTTDPNVLARLGDTAQEAGQMMKAGIPSPLLRPDLLDRGAVIGGPVNPDLAARALGYDSLPGFARAFGVRPADFDDMAWKLPDRQRSALFELISGLTMPQL